MPLCRGYICCAAPPAVTLLLPQSATWSRMPPPAYMQLEDDHQCSLDAWETSLDVSEGLQLTGSPRCTGEQPAGLSDEPGQGR